MKRLLGLLKRDEVTLGATADVSSLSSNSSSSTTTTTSPNDSGNANSTMTTQVSLTSSYTSDISSQFPSSFASTRSASFSRIDGLNTLSSSILPSSSSQNPYYPSSSSRSDIYDSAISSESTTVAKTHSHTHPHQSSSSSPVISSTSSNAKTHHSSSHGITETSTLESSSSSSTSSSITSSSIFVPEITSTTYSYSQEYIITGSATTFTTAFPTQTILSYTFNSDNSASQTFPSFSYQPSAITTDLAFYQSVLSSHGSVESSGTTSKSSNTGKIAGGVVGGVIGLILALLLVWYWCKRRRGNYRNRGDVENPFAGGEVKSIPVFFKKFSKKNASLEELNEKRTPYYGASNSSNNNNSNNNLSNTTNRSFESLSSISMSSMLQRRGSSNSISSSPLRPGLPPRKSSEESLGLGGLSQNILSHQQHLLTKNIVIDADMPSDKHPTSYFAPSDQSDIINSNANSTPFPSRQMDILYEEEISDAASNLESSSADLTTTRVTHYKQSSRYNHIGLTPVPLTELPKRTSRVPPPIPRPRKLFSNTPFVVSQNSSAHIYDTLNIQQQGQLSTGLLDDESFDSSLLDLSSMEDTSSSAGSSNI